MSLPSFFQIWDFRPRRKRQQLTETEQRRLFAHLRSLFDADEAHRGSDLRRAA
jgi:hypothetical protein